MAYIDIYSMMGYNNTAKMFMEAFTGVSNIYLTDNPQFTKEDFLSIFPQFPIGIDSIASTNENAYVPDEAFNLFMAMANKSIKYERYKDSWKFMMCLYIAHMCVLYMQAVSNPDNVSASSTLKGALPKGIATSKSVDGLSISYELVGIDSMSNYGTWALTTYGQQLITLTRIYGKPGMWVNG